MRKLASVRKVDALRPIEGADAIECAVVGGWNVVVKKSEFTAGDLAVFCEIDSWIPNDLAPFLTRGKEPREFNGVKGERLRTIKLRGQLSQGLLLPLSVCNNIESELFDGLDVSVPLNIQKWEMPVPAQLAGLIKGNFPTQIPKTDQERVQNLVREIEREQNSQFEVTEKLEGSSMTCYLIDGVFGVCSRNLDLKRDENNAFWKVAIEQNIEDKMRSYDDIGRVAIGRRINFAIQGELVGPGVQGNIYNLPKLDFYVYDVYDVDLGCYLRPYVRRSLIEEMELKHVPVIDKRWVLTQSVDTLLEAADGKSELNPSQDREGLVFKATMNSFTFKAVSNKYLMGEK